MHRALSLLHELLAADGRAGWRVARAALVATLLVVMAVWLLPLTAFFTGAYPSMPASLANTLRLLAYVTPVALPVAIPIGLAIGVLAACGDWSMTRRAQSAVVVLAIAATALATVLLVRTPARLLRQRARDLDERRLGAPCHRTIRTTSTDSWKRRLQASTTR
jgi:hypothetical protein